MKMRTWAIPAVSLKPTLLLATVLVLLYLLCGSAHAVTLYLDQGGRLSTKLPVNATTYYVSDRNNLEWAYQVSGDISGTRYGYSIYAETTPQSGIYASVEIVLRSRGRETVLARWPRALWGTRGTQRFTGTTTGPDPDTQDGDLIILRISMYASSTYHDYVSVWAAARYPSSIQLPDFGTLSGVDMERIQSQLEPGNATLDQLVQQQNETRKQLDQLTEAVARLETMIIDLRQTAGSQSETDEEEAAAAQPTLPPPPVARLRFVPSVLEFPVEKNKLFFCFLELDDQHSIANVNLETLQLLAPGGNVKPGSEECYSEDQTRTVNKELKICFPASAVLRLFSQSKGQTLFATLELSGRMNDGAPFVGRGVIQIKQKQ